MVRLRAALLLALLPFGVLAQSVTGTATYLQRSALPPDAVFEARVEDVSRADVKAETIGSVRIEGLVNPPIAFTIDVDPTRIDPARRYAVRATIHADGRLMFTTDTATPVLTKGAGTEVKLVMRMAGGSRHPFGKGLDLSALGTLPATFGGDLPCADCPAIRHRLNLFADQSYFLRMAYLERSVEPLYEIGSWLLSADRRTLTLLGGRGSPQQFRIVDASTLRKLDIEGREIDSKLDYSLARLPALETIEPRLAMRGMYLYFADAGLFTECSTRQRWPVAQQADNATLEREYLKVRREPGDEVLVSVDGEVKQLPRMEGAGTIPMLVVRKLTGAWPGETCGARFATAELLNTYWKLVALDGQPVTAAGRQREPHLVLHAKDQRVTGFSGCNRIAGGFALKGNELSFDRMAGTMRACVDGMEGELAFLNALGRVARWKISGEHLELSDAGGKVVARFEARALK